MGVYKKALPQRNWGTPAFTHTRSRSSLREGEGRASISRSAPPARAAILLLLLEAVVGGFVQLRHAANGDRAALVAEHEAAHLVELGLLLQRHRVRHLEARDDGVPGLGEGGLLLER